MKRQIQVWVLLFAVTILSGVAASQTKKKPGQQPATTATPTVQQDSTQQMNINQYIELMRSDVRKEKAQVLGAVMQFNATDAAKFWPIYSEYDTELAKLNKLRSDNILEYARSYNEMSDAKANELITTAIEYQKQRSELLGKYYVRAKDAVGAIQAARFLQVENQLLMLIDLQIASNLPLVEKGENR